MNSIERSSPESESRSSSSTKRKRMEDQMESTKMEMEEVMEENQRLKMHLDKILEDYRALQVKYKDMVETAEAGKGEEEIDDLICLNLGRSFSSGDKHKEDGRKTPAKNGDEDDEEEEGLTLGLDCKFENVKKKKKSTPSGSPENSGEDLKEEVLAGDTWPEKTEKNGTAAAAAGDDDEILQQNPNKRARVSVRVRCDTPTMNDGCQWRKYGQKIAKGNPCPRAYYRCTMAPSCPVRKQVQRSVEDMSILITTYEGNHNHSLPIPATGMASTTSAAASMLLSGSSTGSATATTLNGLNFYLSDSSRPKPYYLPHSSISASPTCPTITLDLTSSAANTPSSSAACRIGNGFPNRYPSGNLNFGSMETNSLPVSWNGNGLLSHVAATHQAMNKNNGSLAFGSQTEETLFRSAFNNKTLQSPRLQQQPLFPDSIAAATKAITSDPNFQSALAAALTSIISSGGVSGEKGSGVSKTAEPFPILSSFPSSTSAASKCAPSFMNKSPAATPPSGGGQNNKVVVLPPPFPFSRSKANSNNPPHEGGRDHNV